MDEATIEIPELQITPSSAQLFMFSAVTWNRHRIHYSKDAALDEGHPDIVVQRALLGNFMARHVGRWLGDHGRILQLSWRVVKSATPGHLLRCQGTATAQSRPSGAGQMRCALRIIDSSDSLVSTGEAVVVV